jgi:hypothetical protein
VRGNSPPGFVDHVGVVPGHPLADGRVHLGFVEYCACHRSPPGSEPESFLIVAEQRTETRLI